MQNKRARSSSGDSMGRNPKRICLNALASQYVNPDIGNGHGFRVLIDSSPLVEELNDQSSATNPDSPKSNSSDSSSSSAMHLVPTQTTSSVSFSENSKSDQDELFPGFSDESSEEQEEESKKPSHLSPISADTQASPSSSSSSSVSSSQKIMSQLELLAHERKELQKFVDQESASTIKKSSLQEFASAFQSKHFPQELTIMQDMPTKVVSLVAPSNSQNPPALSLQLPPLKPNAPLTITDLFQPPDEESKHVHDLVHDPDTLGLKLEDITKEDIESFANRM